MALTADQMADQRKQAEELLFSGPEKLGFAKALFFGHFKSSLLFPYPRAQGRTSALASSSRRRGAPVRRRITSTPRPSTATPTSRSTVVDGLGQLGVLGMTAPKEFGGRGFSQLANTKIMEIIGGHCSSTAVFVNAHHSIGIRALLLFGTEAAEAAGCPTWSAARNWPRSP